MNLSPGPGGKLQNRQCLECAAGCFRRNYSSLMLDGTLRTHLRDTEAWHLNRRYKPLMRALKIEDDNLPSDTRHHLSIELSPFHKGNTDEIGNNKEILFGKNIEEAIVHTLSFAALASTLTVAPKCVKRDLSLHNIVIVRSAFKNINNLYDTWINRQQVNDKLNDLPCSIDIFKLKDEKFPKCKEITKVQFVCLSGARNLLPGTDILTQIIENIQQTTNKQTNN